MSVYAIYAGSCNSPTLIDIDVYMDEATATKEAYNAGISDYETYQGSHGMPDYTMIESRPEDYGLPENPTEDEIYEALREEKENWINYFAVEIKTAQELKELCEEEDYIVPPYLVEEWIINKEISL